MKYNFESYRNGRDSDINHPFILLGYEEGIVQGYGHFECWITYLYRETDGKTYCRTYSNDLSFNKEYTDECILSDLQVTAQRNLTGDCSIVTDDNKPYAMALRYRNADIETGSQIEKSEKRIAFLKRYEKAMRSMIEDMGHPKDFAQWLIYTAKVLGLRIAVRDANCQDGIRYLSATDVPYAIESMLTKSHR